MLRRSSRLRTGFAVLALGAVLTGVLALSPATSVPAAGNPAVGVTPASGVLDGQFLQVSWTGFPAGTPTNPQGVAVSQCTANPVTPNKDCALSELGITDSNGGGVLPIPVHTGAVVARDGKSTFTCDENTPCSVGVYSDPDRSFQSGSPAAVHAINFGFPASACPHGGTAGVSGTGGEAVYRAILRWEAVVCQPPAKLDLQYTRTESSDGKEAFIGDGVSKPPSFAVTSVPLSEKEKGELAEQGRDVITAPVSVSAMVFVFHGTDRLTNQRIANVTLTPSQLAHIFNGHRNSLPVAATSDAEDNDIRDLNPGVNFRGSLQAFGRLDRAAGSLELTSWMLAAAPQAWKDVPGYVAGRPAANGNPPETIDYQTPTDRLPDGLQGPGAAGQLINGPDNLGLLLAGKGSLGDPADMNIMGYLDSSTARFYGFTPVCIQLDPHWRTTHTPCVQATPDTIAKGLAAAKRNGDGTVTPDFTPSDPTAYPIVDVSYLVADANQPSKAQGETLRSLLKFAVNEGQTPAVLPPGYTPLPADLVAVSTSAANAVTGTDPVTPPPSGSPSGGYAGGASFDSGLYRGSLSDNATVAAGAAGGAGKHKAAKVEAVADVHYASSGNKLSGRASWWVVLALTALCLAGLLAHPTVRHSLRRPLRRLRGRDKSDDLGSVTS